MTPWLMCAWAAPAPEIPGTDGVYLPELTWVEVRDRIDAGSRTLLVPTGGIEQNGPFLSLDKHDRIAREVAERTARRLGDALVGPVVSFVPEGSLSPPAGHMRFPGTVGVRDATFAAVLEDIARGARGHGFTTIAFLADSGGSLDVQAEVAARLDRRWMGTRVVHVPAFYDPPDDDAFLRSRGLSWTLDAFHDSPAFTLQLLAIDPVAARLPQRIRAGRMQTDGMTLDADSAGHGEALMEHRAARTQRGLERALAAGPDVRSWLAWIAKPFGYLVDPSQRIFIAYLLSAFFIAFLVELARRGADLKEVLGTIFARDVWLSRDAWNDLVWTCCGGLLLYGFAAAAFTGFTASVREFWLDVLLSVPSPTLPTSPPIVLFATLVMILATDLAVFMAHWAQHKVPFLWTFHQVHHAAKHLTPLTVYRMHPVDLLLNSALLALWVGTATAALSWLFAAPPPTYMLYGLNLFTFGFYLFGYNLRHSHIWVSFGPVEHVLISPAMHQIHHSEAEEHWGRNLGLVFSIWDRLAGTLYLAKGSERPERFGIGADGERFRNALDFLIEPFRQLLR